MAEDWMQEWERRIVNGMYPLRRFLGRSGHSVVFLTECEAQGVGPAAIKILPANPVLAEAQLAHWSMVATLSHPHLIRLIDAGRCQLGGHDFLFVVMERAEQNLAQILPHRPLTTDEVRDLLPPTLDALAYLHGRNLVHGGLKPPNFLVVDDQLKLASDAIRPPGERTASTAKRSLYDPPEGKHGRASTVADLWALGITLVEALAQTPPSWSREGFESVSLPPSLAPEFVPMVQRCLSRDPAQRPTITELRAQFNEPPPEPVPSPTPPTGAASHLESPKTRFVLPAIGAGIIALCALWAAVHRLHRGADVAQSGSTPSASAVSPTTSPPAPAIQKPPAASIASPLPAMVLHQELPAVSRSARASIRGIIKIVVRVIVDRSGTVVAASLDHHATSRYFARAALEAAKKWKFAEVQDPATRTWLLHFDFTGAGTHARAAAPQ